MQTTSTPHHVIREYLGQPITYQEDGWFNATQAAAQFGKRVDHWLDNKETKEYINALCEISNTRKSGYLRTQRGNTGGTWLHPKLAVNFARWLDAKFAVWCDAQIDNIIHDKADWAKQRHIAVASSKLMCAVVKEVVEKDGKKASHYHYSNEHCMVNSLLSGEFKGLQRDKLSVAELDFIAQFDIKNSLMMAKNMPYTERKAQLVIDSKQWLSANASRLPPANEQGKIAA